jgi:hypothetical protein
LRELVRWARFLVAARTEVKYEKADHNNWNPIAAGCPEGPHKVINYFKDLARGHALIHGRDVIDASDIDLIGHIAISSIPGHLRPLLRYLRSHEYVDTNAGADLCRVSTKTVLKYFRELGLLKITHLDKGSQQNPHASKISLASEYDWLKVR